MHDRPQRWRRRRFITQTSAALLGTIGAQISGCGGSEDDGSADSGADGTDSGLDSTSATETETGSESGGETGSESGNETGGDDPLMCDPTAPNIEGPFYRPDAPEQSELAPEMAPGDALTVTGVVRDSDCDPIPNALLDVWQADAEGSYDNDGSGPPPADDEFEYRGRIYADDEGLFEFSSIVPGRYLNGDEYRPAHIHVKVSAPGFELLTTQLYFEGDPYNETDPFIVDELIMTVEVDADGRWRCHFDFTLEDAG